MYRTYSYNDMPKAVTGRTKEPPRHQPCGQPPHGGPSEKSAARAAEPFDGLKTDDIILLAVIAALLLDGCGDRLLIAALAFVFLSDMM